MVKLFSLIFVVASITCPLSHLINAETSNLLFNVETPKGNIIIYTPDLDELLETADEAKDIFIEAFSTNYRQYHLDSGSELSVEKWLRLKDGFTLNSWLGATFDNEFEEYLSGYLKFIYVRDHKGTLMGWLTHRLLAENGDLYISQCSLEAGHRNQKVATQIFYEIFKDKDKIKAIFPGIKELKLIARKINKAANRLYVRAGFIVDITIDPAVYGECYDDRYVGYRLPLDTE